MLFVFPPSSHCCTVSSLPESVWSPPPSGDNPPTKEWVVVGVADSSQLGSVQRMREKMINMQQSAIRETEAGLWTQLQLQERILQERIATAEQSAQQAREQVQVLQQSVNQANTQVEHLQHGMQEANTQIEVLQRRVQEAENRADEAERRTHEARQEGRETGDPAWVVGRDEIIFTDEELGRGG